ncbi:MAG TPA: PAS domain-containing protein [Thermoanaerobaculia bacterium]|jgi:PAS domain S-box-containing protein|nr:PAS domain-containing protein [Thermoanaerobaculia bacterium]
MAQDTALDTQTKSPSEERREAIQRGRARLQGRAEGDEPAAERERVIEADPAFMALAENVRDYAIFLMDPRGVIIYWGEGARLLKWWLKEEAEGSHLRMLYPEKGSEDGTAESHLRDAARLGEYTGEGRRVRRDGSTFWAGVTLTALRNAEGQLFGFAKVTRDLQSRRAIEMAVATTHAAQSARDEALEKAKSAEAAQGIAQEAADFARESLVGTRDYIKQVLEPELEAAHMERARLSARIEQLEAYRKKFEG